MSGDWIKMRGSLCTHPKVLMIAEIIGSDPAVGQRLAPGLSGALHDNVTRDVTRDVTLGCLLRVWAATNEHTDDGVWKNSTVATIDAVAGIPGFGAALVAVGWAVDDTENRTITLPNFLEYNAPAKNGGRTSSASRQARYREKKRAETVTPIVTRDVTPTVTRDVTSVTREEKRREEVKPPKPPRGDFAVPDWLPADVWAMWDRYRKGLGAKAWTEDAKRLAVRELDKLRADGWSPKDVVENAITRGWRGLYAPRHDAPRAAPAQSQRESATEGAI